MVDEMIDPLMNNSNREYHVKSNEIKNEDNNNDELAHLLEVNNIENRVNRTNRFNRENREDRENIVNRIINKIKEEYRSFISDLFYLYPFYFERFQIHLSFAIKLFLYIFFLKLYFNNEKLYNIINNIHSLYFCLLMFIILIIFFISMINAKYLKLTILNIFLMLVSTIILFFLFYKAAIVFSFKVIIFLILITALGFLFISILFLFHISRDERILYGFTLVFIILLCTIGMFTANIDNIYYYAYDPLVYFCIPYLHVNILFINGFEYHIWKYPFIHICLSIDIIIAAIFNKILFYLFVAI